VTAVPRIATPSSTSSNDKVRVGMVLKDYTSLKQLQERVQGGPYPIRLTFAEREGMPPAVGTNSRNKNDNGGAAMRQQQDAAEPQSFSIQALERPVRPCETKRSQRNDLLEIRYEAQYAVVDSDGRRRKLVTYDSSLQRGTGQLYQMVLGSGDMLPGVDQGLYDMCPGERRQITIPPQLGYGARGNRLFRVPPNQTLIWTVELVRIY
jgi:FKBP-type peptidyl-prolyl cis-trans isomerase